MERRNDWGFAEAQWRLTTGTTASERCAAAATLARLAVSRMGEDETPGSTNGASLLLSAGEALARSMQSEISSSVRAAVRGALEEIFAYLGSSDYHRDLLLELVRHLAKANRHLLSRFVEVLAQYAVARRRMSDASMCDPLQRLARLVALGDEETQTHRILRAIAATQECRQAVQEIIERERETGILTEIDGGGLIESLVESAALLREGRDILATAVHYYASANSEPEANSLAAKNNDLSSYSFGATFLAGISVEEELRAYADLAGAAGIDRPSTVATAPNPTVPMPPAKAPAEPSPVATTLPTQTSRRAGGLRMDLAAAAKRATAPLGRPSSGDRLAPFAAKGRMGRLEIINSINAAARMDDPEELASRVEIRSLTSFEEDSVTLASEMEGIADLVQSESLPSIVMSSGTFQIRDKALPKAARVTNADLLEITDLMARR